MRLESTAPGTGYLVHAQIGPMIQENVQTDDATINVIVMAWRDTQREGERECKRRNAFNDGPFYFVMSEAEYENTDG